MKFVDMSISRTELQDLSQRSFGGLVKAVVDIEKEIMVVDACIACRWRTAPFEKGSKQENLWGINFYPELEGEDFLEFDSMINIRPKQNNFSRSVEDPKLQAKIRKIVSKLVIS